MDNFNVCDAKVQLITPGGAVSFVSNLYPGCISDKQITWVSGVFEWARRSFRQMFKGLAGLESVLPCHDKFPDYERSIVKR